MSTDPDLVAHGFTEEMVEVRGSAVHLLRGGAGPPLVYLHGGGAAGLWRRFHALLADRFEVYAPDHPGFGASDDREDVVDATGLASHYLDLADSLGLEHPVLVGASFGGRVACEAILRAPGRFSRLVLLAPVGLNLPDHPVTPLFPRPRAEARDMLFHDQALAQRFSAGADFGSVLGTERDHRALGRFHGGGSHDLAPRLESIALPTLVIWGDSDRVVPAAHGRRFAELLADARLRMIPQCGHGLPFEAPEAVADAITAFNQQAGTPDRERPPAHERGLSKSRIWRL
jgi:pimeloyl-ACP methyl ester carboxylesterase